MLKPKESAAGKVATMVPRAPSKSPVPPTMAPTFDPPGGIMGTRPVRTNVPDKLRRRIHSPSVCPGPGTISYPVLAVGFPTRPTGTRLLFAPEAPLRGAYVDWRHSARRYIEELEYRSHPLSRTRYARAFPRSYPRFTWLMEHRNTQCRVLKSIYSELSLGYAMTHIPNARFGRA